MIKKHILLVENNDVEQELFVDALQQTDLSFFCSTAKSITQAIRILKNTMPDVIFLDLHIADKSGIDFIQIIKSYNNVPLVTYASIQDEEESNSFFNAYPFFRLPGNIKKMTILLKKFLQ